MADGPAATTAPQEAYNAVIRFGLGMSLAAPRPPIDPRGWLSRQLSEPDPEAGRPTDDGGTLAIMAARKIDRDRNLAGTDSHLRPLVETNEARFVRHALTTDLPFRERLVWLWGNHLTVSKRSSNAAPFIAPFFREVIRPHAAGQFGSMLLAAVRHPAMLLYLDNTNSIGPNSTSGRRHNRGLNENLAREILELMTVGRDAGYTQADVTAFAKILTGWRISSDQGFAFDKAAHEPGWKTVMGRTYPEGEEGGIAILQHLADHPATHRRLAQRLVRHFCSHVIPGDVGRIEACLRDTRGNLGIAALVTTQLAAAWQPPLSRIRSPMDYAVACLRALHGTGATADLAASLRILGQPLWSAPQPTGWPDEDQYWVAPEAVLRRVDWAHTIAGRVRSSVEPGAIAEAALGPFLSAATLSEIRKAGSRQDALGLLLAATEFLRR